MKIIVSDDSISLVQREIDLMPDDSFIALSLTRDTIKLSTGNKKTLPVCDADNIFYNSYNFDGTIDEYNEEVADLCILGIGNKGQIGFNEVATPFDSITHVQKLTQSTKTEYEFLGQIPDYGKTFGIKSICQSKRIIVLANGEDKADAIFAMLYGRTDSTVPAAFLQIPTNVDIYIDSFASSKINLNYSRR